MLIIIFNLILFNLIIIYLFMLIMFLIHQIIHKLYFIRINLTFFLTINNIFKLYLKITLYI